LIQASIVSSPVVRAGLAKLDSDISGEAAL
jgi:hypothetical protein